MGPLRRGLTALPVLVPSPALAGVCNTVRPGWDGTPATALSEAVTLFSSPAALALLAASAIAVWLRNQWGALVACLLWTVLVSVVAFVGVNGAAQEAAVAEGCVGSPTLFIAVVAAICGAMILHTAPRPSRD